MLLEVDFFGDDVEGAAFALAEDAADIFAEDADAEELDAAHEKDGDHDGGPAGDELVVIDELADDDEDGGQQREDGDEEAEVAGEAEGFFGEAADAVEGEAEHLAEGELGFASAADGALIGDGALGEADPAYQAADVATFFADLAEGVDDGAVEQAEVAGVERERGVGEIGEEAVEEFGGGEFEGGFSLAGLADAVHDFEAFFPLANHVGDELGGVLEVGVDDDRRVALGVIEAGGDGDLVAEVAGEAKDAD